VLELDERDDGDAVQDYLQKLTGGRSVPRVFIGGQFIGGGDDTAAAHAKGELKAKLEAASAL
jgi:glutaredoxin 3